VQDALAGARGRDQVRQRRAAGPVWPEQSLAISAPQAPLITACALARAAARAASLAAPDGVAGYFITPYLPEFLRAHPEIDLCVDCGLWPDRPLDGEADLTIHADFPGVLAAARAEGAQTAILTQGDFLRRLGIEQRAEALSRARPDQAPAIARQFPQLDVLFVGAGTTGTLMGCARYFKQRRPPVRIVAVDSFGSVIFGGSPGRRMIPGLGMTVRPPLLDESYVDEVVRVEEADSIRACHRLARRGFLFGGSTGTVVSGAMDWLSRHDAGDLTAVAIAPDLGERYLDTVYQTNWIEAIYGKDVLSSEFDVPVQAVHQNAF